MGPLRVAQRHMSDGAVDLVTKADTGVGLTLTGVPSLPRPEGNGVGVPFVSETVCHPGVPNT